MRRASGDGVGVWSGRASPCQPFGLDAGTAARQWSGAEQFLQAASGRIPNPRVSASSGQPGEGTEGVAAEEGTAKVEARDAVAPPSGGGESPEEAAVVSLRTPWL